LGEKVRRNIILPNKTDKDLRSFICEKQGSYMKGDISKWINTAILNTISEPYTRAQYAQCNNPFGFTKGRLRIKNLMQDICYHNKKNYFIDLEAGKFIHLNELKEAIAGIMGYHDVHGRALNDRMKELIKYKYLSNKGPSANLFVVLNTGSDEEEFARIEKDREHSRSPAPQVVNQQKKDFDDMTEGYK
jgi:hypothetical protein